MEIKVNAQQWNSIKEDEQKKILEGLIESGALKEGDSIVPDENVRTFSDGHGGFDKMWDPIGDLCRAACDTAAASAAAWCYANTGGLALPVCLAAASEARKECRKKC